jgi:hypothetical protein
LQSYIRSLGVELITFPPEMRETDHVYIHSRRARV